MSHRRSEGYGPLANPDNTVPTVTLATATLIRYTTPAPPGNMLSPTLKQPPVPVTPLISGAGWTQLPGPTSVNPPGPLHPTR
jgi:hypothetical protein